ncbi:MAG: M20/M25/M40 family metallo-hydrolase [Planctomycetes bacterium]|nr:M20/M25/M40 family metallo-hydrolase [Planctomycetota bacterium]
MNDHRVAALLLPFCLAVVPAGAQTPVPIRDKVAALLARIEPARLESDVRTLASFGTRHVLSATDSATAGTGAARRWLREQFEACVAASGGRLTVRLQEATRPCARAGLPREIPIVNVLATLRGTTDPDRIYVIGGHYDSRNGREADGAGAAPGASDDASGTAVALAACRAMAASEFPATIVFAAYDGEEQGLLGSAAHAEELAKASANVDGMITCDIVGNTLGMDGQRHDSWLRCFSYAPSGNDSYGRSMARACTFAAATHVPGFTVKLIFRGDRYGRGGDHRSFFDAGYPAIRLTEPREDFSRQHANVTERDGRPYGDLPEFCDFAFMANVARVVVATLAELASAPPPPVVQSAALLRDRYDTRIAFTLPAGVEDCEFVWRETTAPDWQGAVRRTDVVVEPGRRAGALSAVLPGVVLDDMVVGVRSVGADGSRSRVATPPEPDRAPTRTGSSSGRDR